MSEFSPFPFEKVYYVGLREGSDWHYYRSPYNKNEEIFLGRLQRKKETFPAFPSLLPLSDQSARISLLLCMRVFPPLLLFPPRYNQEDGENLSARKVAPDKRFVGWSNQASQKERGWNRGKVFTSWQKSEAERIFKGSGKKVGGGEFFN